MIVCPVAGVVMSEAKQFHPFAAVGKPTTPLVAVPPVPTFILKAAVPLLAVTEGDVPKPDEIVGAVALTARVPFTLYPAVAFISPVTSRAFVGVVVAPMRVLPAKTLIAPVLAL